MFKARIEPWSSHPLRYLGFYSLVVGFPFDPTATSSLLAQKRTAQPREQLNCPRGLGWGGLLRHLHGGERVHGLRLLLDGERELPAHGPQRQPNHEQVGPGGVTQRKSHKGETPGLGLPSGMRVCTWNLEPDNNRKRNIFVLLAGFSACLLV